MIPQQFVSTVHKAQVQLERHEGGHRLKMYVDSVGKHTIGLGHNLDDKPISILASRTIFEGDLHDAVDDVLREIPWALELSPVRFWALVNFCFNMGIGSLLGFKRMLTALEAKAYRTAAMELLDSKYREQVGSRAYELAQQIEGDEWK